MGIKGLKSVIKEYLKEKNIQELKGSKICIDTSIFMYKFRYVYDTDNFHILGFLYKIIELLGLGIIPVFVFDGKPPDAKKEVLKKRSEQKNKLKERITLLKNSIEFIDDGTDDCTDNGIETKIVVNEQILKLEKNLMNISKNHYLDVKELFECLGIPFYESISEAEETCAVLQKRGFVDYILTEDTDVLTFGGSNVLFNGKIANLQDILIGLDLNYHEFIDFCILCGCDYTCTIPKVGPVTALKFIKNFKTIEQIDFKKYVVPSSFNYQLARNLFLQNEGYNIDVSFNIGTININKLTYLLVKWNITDIEQIVSKLITLINL